VSDTSTTGAVRDENEWDSGAQLASIDISDIRAYGKHGVLAHEQQYSQPYDLQLHLIADVGAAFVSDDVRDTLDYARLHGRVVRIVTERSFRLLERLGAEIVNDLMSDARVRSVVVRISKPKLLGGATPSVTVSRHRDHLSKS
jgi:dihydroneopterin aldolase